MKRTHRIRRLMERWPGRTVLLILVTAALSLPVFTIVIHVAFHRLASFKADALLTAWLLWWTMLAIGGYTYTTYSHKNIQQEDLENSRTLVRFSAQQLEQAQTPYLEFRAIYYSAWTDTTIDTLFQLRNIGNAIAKNIALKPLKFGKSKFIFPTYSVIPPHDDWINITYTQIADYSHMDQIDRAEVWQDMMKLKPKVQVAYQSITVLYAYKATFQFDEKVLGFFQDMSQQRVHRT